MADDVKGEVLFDDGRLKYIWLGWEEEEDEGLVQTNQYLIVRDNVGVLLDPGGVHVFPRVATNLSRFVDLERIGHIVFSHQDPDVSSGMALWAQVTPAQIHVPKLWHRFLPHFGTVDDRRIVPVPDSGGQVTWPDGSGLRLIPAHFLHSTGNILTWDPVSRILFTGDLGAAVFPHGTRYLWADDFRTHAQMMEGFHRRYLASQIASRKWTAIVRGLDPQILAPQHGALFRGANVGRFLDWLDGLRCGVDIIDEIYGGAGAR